jgi:hypothetical protein
MLQSGIIELDVHSMNRAQAKTYIDSQLKRAKKDITICFLYSKKVFLAKPNITNALNEKKNTVNKTIDHIKLFKG